MRKGSPIETYTNIEDGEREKGQRGKYIFRL